jgi:acetyl-CoA C-acetyltransferase
MKDQSPKSVNCAESSGCVEWIALLIGGFWIRFRAKGQQMAEPVYVIGAGRTDFKRNFRKEGKTIRHIILEAAQAAIKDAGVEPGDIQAGVVGSFAPGLFTRQEHLGAFLTEVVGTGIPTMHAEAACASGAVAVLTAAQQIMGGLRDVALVVGAEQQKTMPPADGADVLGAAADYHVEKPQYGEFMFPKLFARIAQIYMERYGLTEKQLVLVPNKNYAHAKRNPQAQMRDATFPPSDDPCIAPPLTVSHCSQITDGGAAVLLCSEKFLAKVAGATPPRPVVRLLGYGHTTDRLPLDGKDIPNFAVARRAAEQAYSMAGLTARDINGAEVHDCFSISEIVAYELLGFAQPGQGAQFLQKGNASFVNPGGGLIGDGHPVGATGVRQVVEAYLHLTGRAGQRQIDGCERYLTFNIGGSYTTNVCMIWGNEG